MNLRFEPSIAPEYPEYCHPDTCPLLCRPREDALRAIAELLAILAELYESQPAALHALVLIGSGSTMRSAAERAGIPKSTLRDILSRCACHHAELRKLLTPPTAGAGWRDAIEVCPEGRSGVGKG